MRSLIEECESIVNSDGGREYRRYIDIDCVLHRLIILSGGNSLMSEFYETLAVFLQIAKVRLSQSKLDMTRGHEEHKAIVEACEARNRDRLLQVLGSHLRRSRSELLEVARSLAGTK
jgi:DNA-binding GntR family transcriptional regulator